MSEPRPPQTLPQTLVQKLLARAARPPGAAVAAGDTVRAALDLVLLDDAAGSAPLERLLRMLADGPWDRQRTVVVLEAAAPGDQALHALPHVFRGLGRPTLVLAQSGHLRPGQVVACGDAGAAVGGAFGALMLAVDGPRLLSAASQGELALRVPPTLFTRWTGRLPDGVAALDMALHLHLRLAERAGPGERGCRGAALEHCGEAVAALPMGERMTLAALSEGLGACAGFVPPDQHTAAWLRGFGVELPDDAFAHWRSDEDAPGPRHSFDASTLPPHVALPDEPGRDEAGARPAERRLGPRVRVVDDLDPTPVDVACLAGVEGGKFDDLRAAARVLAGFRIAAGVQLLVAPATRLDRELAAREGILRRLVEAGATLLPGTRIEGAAAGDSRVIATQAQPFAASPGRQGPAVHRASAYTVAASALHGRVSDPRAVLA